MATASNTDGKANTTSTLRMMTALTRPPTKPATIPSVPPISSASPTGAMPMSSEVRPP